MKIYEMGTVVILGFVLLSIIVCIASRVDNMKWDEVNEMKQIIEKQHEKDEKEAEEKQQEWLKREQAEKR